MAAKSMACVDAAKELVERVETLEQIEQFCATIPSLQNDDSSSEELLPVHRRTDQTKLQHARNVYNQYLEDARMRDISGPLIAPPPAQKGEGYLEQIYAEFDPDDPNFAEKVKQRVSEAARHTVTLPIECMPPQSYQKLSKQQLPQLKRLNMSAQDSIFVANRENEYIKETIEQPPLVAGHVVKQSKLAEMQEPKRSKIRKQKGMQEYTQFVQQAKDDENTQRKDHYLEVRGGDLERIKNARERVPKVSYESDIQPRDLLRLEQNVQKMNSMGSLVKGYEYLYK